MGHHSKKSITLLALLCASCNKTGKSDSASFVAESREPLVISSEHARTDLENYKQGIRAYSKRHYMTAAEQAEESSTARHVEDTWELKPRSVALHYTAGQSFPWNLVEGESSGDEPPGISCHFVVQGKKIFQLLPTNVRSRCTYGANHVALSIEMVALDEDDLATRTDTLDQTARLVAKLVQENNLLKFGKLEDVVVSHERVSKMDKNDLPWVKDTVDGSPYSKPDPGTRNMKYILERVKLLLPSASEPSKFCKVQSSDGVANVRSGPGTENAVITRRDNQQPLELKNGASVKMTREVGKWSAVELRLGGVDYGDAKGIPAWIYSSLLVCQ